MNPHRLQHLFASHPAYRTSGYIARTVDRVDPRDYLQPMTVHLLNFARSRNLPMDEDQQIWDAYNQMAEESPMFTVYFPRCRTCRGLRVEMRTGGQLCRTCKGSNSESVQLRLQPVEAPVS